MASRWNLRRAHLIYPGMEKLTLVDVVPLECEAEVFLPGPVLGDLVILPDRFEQVIGVFLPCVLDPKIVDEEGKIRSDVWWRQRDGVCGTKAYPFLARLLVSRSLASCPA